MQQTIQIGIATVGSASGVLRLPAKLSGDVKCGETFAVKFRCAISPTTLGQGTQSPDGTQADERDLQPKPVASDDSLLCEGQPVAAPAGIPSSQQEAMTKVRFVVGGMPLMTSAKGGTAAVRVQRSCATPIVRAPKKVQDNDAARPEASLGNPPTEGCSVVVLQSELNPQAAKPLATVSEKVVDMAASGKLVGKVKEEVRPDSTSVSNLGPREIAAGDTRPAEETIAPRTDSASPLVALIVAREIATTEPPAFTATASVVTSGLAVTTTHGVGKAVETAPAQIVAEARSEVSDLKTMVATPNVLEVGIASGAHGWVRVRAEFGQAGEVAASVTGASVGAAESLHKELPALSAYLAVEHVGVGSLIVNAAEKGAGTPDSAIANGSRGDPQPQSESQRQNRDSPSGSNRLGRLTTLPQLSEIEERLALPSLNIPRLMTSNGRGSWLSVRV